MPCAVFCVSSWPVMPSRGVLPAGSLPRLRMALSRSNRSKLEGPILKAVVVCSDRASSPTVSPLADKRVSPDALPAKTARWFIARSALLTSMPCGLKVPLRRSPPLSGDSSVNAPLAVPPPRLMRASQRSSCPWRVSVRSAGGVMSGRRICAVRGRQPASNPTSPAKTSRTPVREIQVTSRKANCASGRASTVNGPGFCAGVESCDVCASCGAGLLPRLRKESCGTTPPSSSARATFRRRCQSADASR